MLDRFENYLQLTDEVAFALGKHKDLIIGRIIKFCDKTIKIEPLDEYKEHGESWYRLPKDVVKKI